MIMRCSGKRQVVDDRDKITALNEQNQHQVTCKNRLTFRFDDVETNLTNLVSNLPPGFKIKAKKLREKF